tara:strand:+ start:30908 stop:31882 length:975 start_codon:yes stop_codon:yes gene_type:complete
MPRTFVSRQIFPEYIKSIQDNTEAEIWEDELPPSREVLLEKVRGIDGLLCLLTDQIDAELMDTAGPQLKVISQIAVGYNNIDIPEATKRGIPVGYTPDVLTQTTADATLALMLAAGRRITESERAVRDGNWRTWHPLHFLGQDLYDATVGIIGMGRIGLEVAKRCLGFDANILYYDVAQRKDLESDYPLKFVDLDTIFRESDFVSIHTVLDETTHHLINAEALSKMKNNSILVNAARGPIVDHKALYNALSQGEIAGAGLDVTDPEPIPLDDPLLTLDNCVIVPHIASASVKTRYEMSRISATNLLNGIKGEKLLTCVNPEVYE